MEILSKSNIDLHYALSVKYIDSTTDKVAVNKLENVTTAKNYGKQTRKS